MPAKDGKYMTKGGTEIIVQRGRIIKITGRGGKSVKPGDERAFREMQEITGRGGKSVSPGTREGADPFGGTSGTPTSIPPKDPWIPGTQQKVLKGGQK